MPIYEYEALDPEQGCPLCRAGFELVHRPGEAPCAQCPQCGRPVRKIISQVRAVIKAPDGKNQQVMGQIRDYEREGKWSHAAELADSHAADTKDSKLQERAMDNYKKAGTDPG